MVFFLNHPLEIVLGGVGPPPSSPLGKPSAMAPPSASIVAVAAGVAAGIATSPGVSGVSPASPAVLAVTSVRQKWSSLF